MFVMHANQLIQLRVHNRFADEQRAVSDGSRRFLKPLRFHTYYAEDTNIAGWKYKRRQNTERQMKLELYNTNRLLKLVRSNIAHRPSGKRQHHGMQRVNRGGPIVYEDIIESLARTSKLLDHLKMLFLYAIKNFLCICLPFPGFTNRILVMSPAKDTFVCTCQGSRFHTIGLYSIKSMFVTPAPSTKLSFCPSTQFNRRMGSYNFISFFYLLTLTCCQHFRAINGLCNILVLQTARPAATVC
eukprot:284816350_2